MDGEKIKKIDDNLTFLLIEKGKDIILNGVEKRAIVTDIRDTIGFTDDKLIRISSILQTGDIIEYQDIKWMVISEVSKERLSYKGKIRKINYQTNMVINSKLEVLDCIFSSYTNRIDETKYLDILEDIISFTVAETELTKNIKLSFRFIKFGRAWKVLGRDYTHKNLIRFTAKTDFINSNTDDIELEIANKDLIMENSPVEPEEPPLVNTDEEDRRILISDGIGVTFKGGTIGIADTFELPILKLSEGVTATWSSSHIQYIDNFGVVNRPDATTGNVDVTLTLTLSKGTQSVNYSYLFKVIALDPVIIPSPTDNFTIEIFGADKILPYSTETYTATVRNNGEIVTNKVVSFTINTTWVSMVSATDTTIGIENSVTKSGGFVLRATLVDDPTITVTKDITYGY